MGVFAQATTLHSVLPDPLTAAPAAHATQHEQRIGQRRQHAVRTPPLTKLPCDNWSGNGCEVVPQTIFVQYNVTYSIAIGERQGSQCVGEFLDGQLPRGFSTKELAAFFQQLRLGTAPTVAAPHGGIDPGIPTGECSLDVQACRRQSTW